MRSARVDRSTRHRRLSLLAFSLVFALLAAELLLRWLTPESYWLDKSAEGYWCAVAAEGGKTHEATVFDPVLGWRMRPGYRADGVHHDSRGFRGTREYGPGKRKLRVLALGDSFTYGLGVADEDTYPAQLERISGAQVINAGVNGYGIDQMLLMWEQEGRTLAPQLVVLGYYVDDFHRNALRIREFPKPWFGLDSSGELELHRMPPNLTEATFEPPGGLRVYRALASLVRRARRRWWATDEPLYATRARLSELILDRLNQSVRAAGARLLVVAIGRRFVRRGDSWIIDSVAAACRAGGIDFLDLRAEMREGDYAGYYGPHLHFSERGNEFAARQIAAALGLVK